MCSTVEAEAKEVVRRAKAHASGKKWSFMSAGNQAKYEQACLWNQMLWVAMSEVFFPALNIREEG